MGFLIAFGGEALLSALVLDLVSSALEREHITELTVGSLAGSLFFIGANSLVNQYGGFLRKPSTMLEHMSYQQAKRFKDVLRNLKRIDIFKHLPAEPLWEAWLRDTISETAPKAMQEMFGRIPAVTNTFA